MEFIWQLRLKKLLDLCITQLSVNQTAQAIPLRMLETFGTQTNIERYIEDESLVHSYLERIFGYLVNQNYYGRLRILLDAKCPPLDGETLHAPNPFTEALFQLMLRPLLLKFHSDVAHNILINFSQHILSQPHSDAIRNFILPCLAECEEFPFNLLLQSLLPLMPSSKALEKIQMDAANSNNASIVTFTGASALNYETNKKEEKKTNQPSLNSSYMLYALLMLDRKHLDSLHSHSALGTYIKILADLTPQILQLPKSSLKFNIMHEQHNDSSSDDEDSEDDEDANDVFNKKTNHEMEVDVMQISAPLSQQEKQTLLHCIEMLNDASRVKIIVEHIEEYMDDTQILHGLCEICHNLMIYNKLAIFEYK